MRQYLYRTAALSIWLYGFWLLLTWTATAEQLIFGAMLSIAVAASMARLGTVVAPWRLANPRRLLGMVVLAGGALLRILRANVVLARRIWSPRRPLRSGMIIVPTTVNSDGELAAVGLITSLIVDNQIVDLDRSERELQYHAVWIPDGSGEARAEHVNLPTERKVARIKGGR